MSDATNPPCGVLLPRNLAVIAKCCIKADNCRFGGMSGVHLERTAEGYTATATDGKTLATVSGPTDSLDEYPKLPALVGARNSGTAGTIAAKDWSAAFKAIPKQGRYFAKPILDNVAAVIAPNQTTLVSTDLASVNTTVANHLTREDGKPARFPEWRKALPHGKPIVVVSIDPSVFGRALDVAGAFTDDSNKRVDLHIYSAAAPVKLTVNNEHGQRFTGLCMPLVLSAANRRQPASSYLPAPMPSVLRTIARLTVVMDRSWGVVSYEESAKQKHAEDICGRCQRAILALTAKYLS